jgi:hypothetical protein
MPVSFNIQVSLAVFKALTSRLEEGQTHDDVIRELLELDSVTELEPPNPFERFEDITGNFTRSFGGPESGFYSRGLWLPNGTLLRARYKQRLYEARIADGKWLDADGNEHTSPSAAASAITSTNVNGLHFWEAQRPTDSGWRRLQAFVADKR